MGRSGTPAVGTGFAARGCAAAAVLLAAASAPARVFPIHKPATEPAAPPPAAPAAAATPSRWYTSLDAAWLHGQQYGQPMLVFVGSDTVAASREAWAGLAAADDQLSPWTAVRLDGEADRDVARSLGVVGVPTLLALTPDGRRLAAVDHPLSGATLAGWLDQQRNRWGAGPVADTGASTDQLVKRLGAPDAATREAAVRQLRDHPAPAAVVEALATGSQQQRLAAADLLDGWHAAGIGDVDPWAPATLTADRLAAVRAWAKSAHPATTAPVVPVSDELDALATARTPIAAAAVRERLLRYGPAVLPQVVKRLAANPPDPARGRLVALRYRLCATDRLAAAWPGGFDRVASADAQVRRQAAADLVTVATSDDLLLLGELFADADPFVREKALLALRTVGGTETNATLVRLLGDPEPNVRAAVLNTLADNPSSELAKDVAKFAAAEGDVDLVVHAVHVLELTPGATSFDALVSLLDHKQWRVRGEAAEALRGRLSGREPGGDSVTPQQKAAGFAGLVRKLDDPEGYVVTRAVQTITKVGVDADTMGPMMAAAGRRADVARDVLKAVAGDGSLGQQFLPGIRQLSHSNTAGVRAAAVAAVVEVDPDGCGPDVQAALADADPAVRSAGLRATVGVLASLLNGSGNRRRNPLTGESTAITAEWVDAFRTKGVNRPAWLAGVGPVVAKAMATAPDRADRVAAAVVLCAVGRDAEATATLTAAAADPATAALIGSALPWVPWEKRVVLFEAARSAGGTGATGRLTEAFVAIPDPRTAGPLWDVLARPGASTDDLAGVLPPLRKLYLHEVNPWNTDSIPPADRAAAVAACKPRAEHGVDLQRTAAMVILLSVSPTDAATVAAAIGADPRAGEWLRLDALQIRLLALQGTDPDAAGATAVAALSDPALRKVAVPYLAVGSDAVQTLRGSVYLYSSGTTRFEVEGSGSSVVTVQPPKGLTVEPVRAVLDAAKGNADLTGQASYLLVLAGDRSGMEPLVAAARSHALASPWDKLVYRAIAFTNDSSRVPVLAEIYKATLASRRYEVREMYWTIRSMTGPAVLKLRAEIRAEYGMNNLR